LLDRTIIRLSLPKIGHIDGNMLICWYLPIKLGVTYM
jgi:hypothetical protein